MRLIDADALKIENVDLEHGCTVVDYALATIKAVTEAPTIDPESLRPLAVWELKAHKETVNYRWNVTAKCTDCETETDEIWAGFFPGIPDAIAESVALDSAESVQLSNFCPNCGAKMTKDGA